MKYACQRFISHQIVFLFYFDVTHTNSIAGIVWNEMKKGGSTHILRKWKKRAKVLKVSRHTSKRDFDFNLVEQLLFFFIFLCFVHKEQCTIDTKVHFDMSLPRIGCQWTAQDKFISKYAWLTVCSFTSLPMHFNLFHNQSAVINGESHFKEMNHIDSFL